MTAAINTPTSKRFADHRGGSRSPAARIARAMLTMIAMLVPAFGHAADEYCIRSRRSACQRA